MKCIIDNCTERPQFTSLLGFICKTHDVMIGEEVRNNIFRICLECKNNNCIHFTTDGSQTPPPSDFSDTLGVYVADNVKSGDKIS